MEVSVITITSRLYVLPAKHSKQGPILAETVATTTIPAVGRTGLPLVLIHAEIARRRCLGEAAWPPHRFVSRPLFGHRT